MKRWMFFILLCPALIIAQETIRDDIWKPFNFFIGAWEGIGGGQLGKGTGKRNYEKVLNNQFLHFQNSMVFESRQDSTEGEIHHDFGVISFDRGRKKYVLRQFYSEGYINQFVLDTLFTDQKTYIFVTENVENGPKGIQARITLSIIDSKNFSETFELASPGKAYNVCVINRWKRTESL